MEKSSMFVLGHRAFLHLCISVHDKDIESIKETILLHIN